MGDPPRVTGASVGGLRRLLPVLAALLLLALAGAVTFRHLVTVRTDMADLLPPGSTPAARLLARELRSGAASSLLLVAVEGAPVEELARLSRAVAEGLRGSGLFSLVANGAEGFADGPEQAFLFRHRYLLSPAITPEAFEVGRLREGLRGILAGLSGAGSPLVERYGLTDPTGAFLALAGAWAGEATVEVVDGVWVDPGAGRALLLARTAAAGLEIEAGRAAVDAARSSFARAGPGPARLIVSGPAAFAVEAADAIRADVKFLSVLSSLLIAGFLYWRHRSLPLLAAVAIPLAAGTLAGALAVQLAFGAVHGITLGFGVTMLGVADDYPLLLLGQRRPGEDLSATARRIGPTLALAVATGALGLTSMLLSSFPGLAQLGLFAATGLLVAGAVTRWILPRLVAGGGPAAGVGAGDGALVAGTGGLRRWRFALLAPVAVAGLYLALSGGPAWETDLANLSPVPEGARNLDGELRRGLGAPDVRHLVAIEGADAEAVLRASERLALVVGRLAREGAVGGAELPSRFLPSGRTQLERRAALPTPEDLRARLAEAGAGLPFRPTAFDGFVADAAAARAAEPVAPADLAAFPAFAARLDPLLFERDGRWFALAALVDVRRPEAVRDAVAAGLDDPAARATYVDVKAETEGLVAAYAREALGWLALGGTLLLAAVSLALRRPAAVARVAAPLACATVVTLAVLDLAGVRLTLFHLASLLLMAGVSVDYALFLNREPDDDEAEGARTLGAVLTCNGTTLLTFGLLVFCRNPVLRGVGATVLTGGLAAIVFALAFSRAPRREAA